ncbi:Cadherin EGF LAG seven-pass G-type receptor 1 [Bienertia sinuspersici]
MKVKNQSSYDYVKGVDNFLNFALSNVREEDKEIVTIRCPCNNCQIILFKRNSDVRLDLLKWGIYDKYSVWEFHGEVLEDVRADNNYNDFNCDNDIGITMLQDAFGVASMNVGVEDELVNDNENVLEEPNENAKKFYRLLKQDQEPLTVKGMTMAKLAYIVKLLHMKVLYNWCDSSSDSLLKFERQAWGINIPDSYYEAKKLIKDLGLDYLKIDAFENDCILYWKENENLNECPTCGLLRWKNVNDNSLKGVKVLHKVLRYFPLKPRLQRLYMSRKMAKDMQWQKEEILDDNIMRHPCDSYAWKSFDEEYGDFAKEARNVRLGLACDGFQPFNNSQHSIWPVVLIPYSLSPWICVKPHSFLLNLLIPGPSSPWRNIDVYLRPLIEELKDLWKNGVETYDAFRKENFKLRASLLWTINDFPAYGDLLGWTTKGHFACPSCHKEIKRTSLKHKGGYLRHRRWLPSNHKWRKDACSFDNK